MTNLNQARAGTTMPDDIPEDVWNACMADAAGLRNAVIWQSNEANEIIAERLARAILAERERCADLVEAHQRLGFALPGEETLVKLIANAIRDIANPLSNDPTPAKMVKSE